MLTITLQKLQFHAYHGFYDEEKIIGNNFEIDIAVTIDVPEKITEIKQTVDYVIIYELVKKRMQQPTQLLETVAQQLADNIHSLDERVNEVQVTIKKLSPPIEQFEGSISIHYKKAY